MEYIVIFCIIGFGLLLHVFLQKIEEFVLFLTYKHERRIFNQNVASNNELDVPVRRYISGKLSVEFTDVMKTKKFQDDLSALKRIAADYRSRT